MAEDICGSSGCVDPAALAARIETMRPDFAAIVHVDEAWVDLSDSARHWRKLTVVAVLGVLGVPIITPAHFGLSPNEQRSRAKAMQFWPERRDLFGRRSYRARAEAALLARFAAHSWEVRRDIGESSSTCPTSGGALVDDGIPS